MESRKEGNVKDGYRRLFRVRRRMESIELTHPLCYLLTVRDGSREEEINFMMLRKLQFQQDYDD